MDFAEMMNGVMEKSEDEHKDGDLEHITEAMNRPRIEGLTVGDKIKEKKLGEEFTTKSEGAPVIFVRYLTEAEKVAVNLQGHGKVSGYDAVLAFGIDRRDGELLMSLADTSIYERA